MLGDAKFAHHYQSIQDMLHAINLIKWQTLAISQEAKRKMEILPSFYLLGRVLDSWNGIATSRWAARRKWKQENFIQKLNENLASSSITSCSCWQWTQTPRDAFDKRDPWIQDGQHPRLNRTSAHSGHYPSRQSSGETSRHRQNLREEGMKMSWLAPSSVWLFRAVVYKPNDEQADNGVGGGNSSLTWLEAKFTDCTSLLSNRMTLSKCFGSHSMSTKTSACKWKRSNHYVWLSGIQDK